jgi:glycosyltransferase involved in cell wall biosynthesis
MTASIIIGTFGDVWWSDLANERALPSALAQDVEVVHSHGDTLAQARNDAAETTTGDYLIPLDADDELAPGYVEAILSGSADLRSPAIQYVYLDHEEPPKLLKPKNLRRGNYLPIGTAIRRDLFMEVGGFRDLPAWEDWDLAVRCFLRGATIEQIPEAIYRAYWSPTGRNNLTQQQAVNLMRRLRRDHALEERRLKSRV